MAVETQKIWSPLVSTNKFGILNWKSERSNIFYGDEPDPRVEPQKYMCMSGTPRKWIDYEIDLSTSDLRLKTGRTFETNEGAYTGTLGLLQVAEMFSLKPKSVDETLLIGAISDKSLMTTLRWLVEKDYSKSHTTLVDLSEIPLKHIQTLAKLGYFDGAPSYDLVQKDLVEYSPTKKPNIIIGDILTNWAVPRFSLHENPYVGYQKILDWVKGNLSEGGIFYSRCMVFPEDANKIDPNIRTRKSAEDRAEMILSQLGESGKDIDREWLIDSVEEMFYESKPATFCGLENVYSEFQERPTLVGEKAESAIRTMYKETFQNVEEIRVIDNRSGFVFLNFACQI